jgi:hypothetical protein
MPGPVIPSKRGEGLRGRDLVCLLRISPAKLPQLSDNKLILILRKLLRDINNGASGYQ